MLASVVAVPPLQQLTNNIGQIAMSDKYDQIKVPS